MLPNSEVLLFRAIDKAALVLLLMIRLDKPIGRNEIANILGISRPTAADHLRSLAQIGLITRSSYHTGYILTMGGRQLILEQTQAPALVAHPDPQSGKALPPEALQALSSVEALSPQDHTLTTCQVIDGALLQDETDESQRLNALDSLDEDGDSKESSPLDSLSKNELKGKKFFYLLNRKGKKSGDFERQWLSPLDSSDSLKKKEKLIKLNTSSSLRTSTSDFLPLPTAQELLDASPILFGKPGVIQHNLPARLDPRAVLGWLAQAYTERSLLDTPAALVYARLRDHCLPRSEYLQHAVDYLPDDYLVAVGLLPESEPESDPDPVPQSLVGTDGIRPDPPDPSLTPAHLHAWDAVLSEMQRDLPAQAFASYLRDSRPLRWEDGCLIISTPDPYARDWLASRLTSAITRLLVGILNQPARVQFE